MKIRTDFAVACDWLEKTLGLKFVTPHCGYYIVGKDENDIIAAVVFTDYTGQDVHINLAGRAALSRLPLRVNAHIPFTHLGCKRLTGLTKPGSTMATQMHRLGFKSEGRMRQYYPDGSDAMIWGMLKDECRWF